MRKTIEQRIDEAAEKKLAALLSNVDLTGIVRFDERTKQVFINGERVDDKRMSNLKAEAQFLVQSDLWKLLHETPKELAQHAMFVLSESLVDLQKGKSILYTLSTQKKILEMFLNYGEKKVA